MPLMVTETARNRINLDRRTLLAGFCTLAALPVTLQGPLAAAMTESEQLFASALKTADGRFAVAILNDYGQILARIPLPARGHGIAVSPDRTLCVAFARRPGTFAAVFRPTDPAGHSVVTASAGRHFYGHGCFSADSRLLYAVENDYDSARGVLGVYRIDGGGAYRIGELDTFGIGPHDILLAPDGQTLIVANGGIRTHPGMGREKLNLDTMKPSVVFINAATGDLLDRQELEPSLHQVSLRHMALDSSGQAWVGGQYEGAPENTPPLVVRMARDAEPVVCPIADGIARSLQNYIGSVASNRSGDIIATSAPRGGKTLFWAAATGELLGVQPVADGCGVAGIDEDSFLVTDGHGGLSYVSDQAEPAEVLARVPGASWDNHLTAL